MSKWNDEKTKVKDIFDVIRNFGLTGVVFYVGVYSFALPTSNMYLKYVVVFTGVSLILLSVYLFFINAVSFNKTVREEHIAGNVGSLFYHLVPAVIIMLGVNLVASTTLTSIKGGSNSQKNSTEQEVLKDAAPEKNLKP